MTLAGKKIVLIGGAGFIGSHTVDALLREPVGEVVVYVRRLGNPTNLEAALRDPRLRVEEAGDQSLAPDRLRKSLQGADAVIHLASMWLLHCERDPDGAFETNVRGTYNVIQACSEAKVGRLVLASSNAVYGDAVTGLLDEDGPLVASSIYGATKIAGEAMLLAYQHRSGLSGAALRYMNVYGPRQAYEGPYISVIMKMLDAIDRGEGPTIVGDGSELFDFVAVEDCAAANVKALAGDAKGNFNIGTGQGTSLQQLAEMLIELTGADVPINFVPRPGSASVRSRVGSPRRAAAELGFEAETGLREGLARLIAWRAGQKARIAA